MQQDMSTMISAAQLQELMQARRTIRPKNMTGPGPDAGQLALILGAAAHAPDHGRKLPWRLLQVPQQARDALEEAFHDALLEREPEASTEQLLRAREKAFRSPELLLMVVRCDAFAAFAENCVAAGCALQNMLLAATSLGFASGLASGESLQSTRLRDFFGLAGDEHALCFMSLGTLAGAGQKPRGERPTIGEYVHVLRPAQMPVE